MNRRTFLKSAGTGLVLSAMQPAMSLGASGQARRVGLIGCGWYGKAALLRLLQVEPAEVVALCDVDRNMLEEAGKIVASRQKSGKTPALYGDYRQMLKDEKLDIVQVSTPDHWHALAMIAAVKAGADVYVEKPISTDVVEGQAMVAAARKYGRVVQVNTQRRSTPHLIEARDKFINTGKLGKIGHVEIYSYYHMRARGNPPTQTPPAYFDYDMWTGPAPMRPYNSQIHPRRWRAYMEYGNGIMGDMCIHMFDMIRWMLNLGWPGTISSSGGIYIDKDSISNITDTQTATFNYPDQNLSVVWQHRTWGHAVDPDYPWGATIYGDQGTLKLSVMRYDFIPRDGGETVHQDVTYEFEQYPEDKTEKDLERHVAPAMRAHWKNFLKAVDNRSKPIADIEQGFISSACCILANVSQQVQRTLAWDPGVGALIDDKRANALLARPYREPWVHPHPDTV